MPHSSKRRMALPFHRSFWLHAITFTESVRDPHEAITSRTAKRRFVLRRIEHLRIVVPWTLSLRVSDRASAVYSDRPDRNGTGRFESARPSTKSQKTVWRWFGDPA